MNTKFGYLLGQVETLFDQLLRMDPVQMENFPRSRVKKGVYLFTDPKEGPMYVGKSDDIRSRWSSHCDPGSRDSKASFAFRRAREATGKTKASYQPGPNSRKGLLNDPRFKSEFEMAKKSH